MRLIAPLVMFDRTPRARGDGFIHFGSSHNQGHAHGRRVYHSFDRITDLCAAGRAAGGQRGAACSKSASSRSFLSLPPPLGFLITAIRIIDNEMFFYSRTEVGDLQCHIVDIKHALVVVQLITN